MQINLNGFDKIVRLLVASFAIFAAIILFHHPVLKLVAVIVALWTLTESLTGKCYLMSLLGKSSPAEGPSKTTGYLLGLCAIQITLAYEWLSAAVEKLSNPEFITYMGGALTVFASKNPFPWYKIFLEEFAMPNASLFGYAVEWGQLLVGLALAVAAVILLVLKDIRKRKIVLMAAIIGLIIGMVMNAAFYFAAGWTGPGTKGINVIMFWAQGILAYVWLSEFIASRSSYDASSTN